MPADWVAAAKQAWQFIWSVVGYLFHYVPVAFWFLFGGWLISEIAERTMYPGLGKKTLHILGFIIIMAGVVIALHSYWPSLEHLWRLVKAKH